MLACLVVRRKVNALLLADGADADALMAEVNGNPERYAFRFEGVIRQSDVDGDTDASGHVRDMVKSKKIKVIVADTGSNYVQLLLPGIFERAFLKFRFTYFDFNRMYEETFDRVACQSLSHDWFLSNIVQSQNLLYKFTKRSADIVLALILLIPSLFLLPFVVLAIKLEDGGPILYTTERVGQFNQPIHIFKFRTKNGSDSGAQALKSVLVDTRIGKFLRKSRIDELPQLINVLKGDLSFVGPRPEMPALAEVYAREIPFYSARHYIKPGLSGWAQVNDLDAPRGGIDLERTSKKLSYDLFYLKRHSLLLDVQTALKTVSILLGRTGS